MNVVTHKEVEGSGWMIDDPIIRLRRWGTADGYTLPADSVAWTIGAAEDCDLQLHDPSACVSRHHARLYHEAGAWTIRDLDSTNGIRQDGERRLSFQLAPGVELEIGGVRFVAESARLAELHAFLARIIGWGTEQLAAADRALRAVRDVAIRRTALVLAGAGDLTSIARRIHDLTLGRGRPFVLAEDQVSSLLERAVTGTLCIVVERLPRDFVASSARLRANAGSVRLVICAPTRDVATDAMAHLERSATVELPALATRSDELDRLILAYAADAVAELEAPGNGFREFELQWLRGAPLASIAEIEELARRVVALRTWGVSGGAQRLGISHVALSRWARRRKIPT